MQCLLLFSPYFTLFCCFHNDLVVVAFGKTFQQSFIFNFFKGGLRESALGLMV